MGDMSPQMEQIMRATGQAMPATKRILEVNAGHALIKAMEARFKADPQDPKLDNFAQLLHGQALLAEGGQLSNPAAFAELLAELMVMAARQD